jgi:hypothetical protein
MEDDLKKKWKTTSKKMEDKLKKMNRRQPQKEEEPINQNQPDWL